MDCIAGKYKNSSGVGNCECWYSPPHTPVSPPDSPTGRYVSTTGATSCIGCEDGTLAWADRTKCGSCPAGTYVFDETSCEDCTAGKYAPSAQTDDCLVCEEGSYTGKASGSTSCSGCGAGKFSTGGPLSLSLSRSSPNNRRRRRPPSSFAHPLPQPVPARLAPSRPVPPRYAPPRPTPARPRALRPRAYRP